MEYESFTVAPWAELIIKRQIRQQESSNKYTYTVSDLTGRVRKSRGAFLGADMSLEALVTDGDAADVVAINSMIRMLTTYAVEFVRKYGTPSEQERYEDYWDFFETFFKYSLYMYTTDKIGDDCVDDLIQLATCYYRDPVVYRIVGEDCLPPDMVDDLRTWIGYPGEHPLPPKHFEDYVTASVAALVGTMAQPC